MSNYFTVSISIDYLVIIHKESSGIIFIRHAPGVDFDPKFIEELRRAIQFEEVELPQTEGDITQGTVKGKYVIIRAGKWTNIILVINTQPNRFTREALHSFGIRLESRWGRELKDIFNDMQGDIDAFRKDTETRQSVTKLTDEIFHLEFTLPHKLGLPSHELKGIQKRIWSVAEELARGQGYILLGELLSTASEKFSRDKADIPDVIYDFVLRGYMTPIQLDEFVQKYANKK
jgi:hypothetical protein